MDRDQTVSGRGYQFTGEIRELGAGASTRQVSAPLAVPAPSPATNLSESVSELTGREAALSEATDLVTTDRLVTPIGEGEIGKRGLGLQVAQQVQSEFADGVRVTGHDAAERRQITAMSCAAIGPAARADGIGLQDLREAIGAFQQCVSEIAGRHSGFIASRLGNTVLVLFGYPAAHEHDAEEAIRAGARIVRGGQDPETRRRCADAVPGRHSDGNGHRW